MSEHKKTITSISWNPQNSDLLASSASDKEVIIWNVSLQKVMSKISKISSVPITIEWSPLELNLVTYSTARGPLVLWNFSEEGSAVTFHKDVNGFTSDVCHFRWHHKVLGKLVIGHLDGSLSLFISGWLPFLACSSCESIG